ncbi:hypothetical protein ACJMK2_029632 [Sinanodonta woodiana]|uniref:DDE Tnp4 domain-containing protein n=1 Tax=Sinanodonta woodiana TaxID=1069815 RepID=A0ABD3XED8_SINWO
MAALNDTEVLLSICEGIWTIEGEDSDLVNKFNDSILLGILARRDDVANFRRHFRIGKTVYNLLLAEFADALFRKDGGRDAVSPAKQLLVFPWHISNLESVRETANLFGISLTNSANKFIKWPDHDRRHEIVVSFQAVSGFPDVAGVIDGTRIRLVNLVAGERDYINRKVFPSVQLQIVVDDRMLITDAFVGWPGSTHDARVLRNSPLYEKAENNQILRREFLIGDSAYPLKIWLQTNLRDNGYLTAQQRRYNRVGVRQTVEMAIGHLKGRFRRLTALHCTDVEKICHLVIAACVLHNLCILTDDAILIFINMEEAEDDNQYHNSFRNAVMGEQQRNQLLNLF